MSNFFLAKAYLKYFFKARGAHATHSPFVYNFIQDILKDKRTFYAFAEIASLRNKLLQNETTIQVLDLGAGSLHTKSNHRKIAAIAKHAARSKKYGELLFRIVQYFDAKNILELGTSLGIGTSYLAKAQTNAKIISIEGSENIRKEALKNFDLLEIKNVESVLGNFDDVLEPILQSQANFDFIYIDGNHKEKPTLAYFELCKKYIKQNCIILFDDIHWSEEMQYAWEQIKKDVRVNVSIDLFQFGLVFFMNEIHEKEDFILRF